jgi:hypothetical protein
VAYCPPGSGPVAKPGSPAAIFLSGLALEEMIIAILGVNAAWASIIAYSAAYTISTATLCGADPPAMPSFTAVDVLAILTSSAAESPVSFQKLHDLLTIAAWNTFCKCSPGATPAVPAWPAYPATSPQVNPPQTPILTSPCFEYGEWFETNTFGAGCNFTSAFWTGRTVAAGVTALDVEFSSSVFAGPSPYPLNYTLTYFGIDGSTLGTSTWSQSADILFANRIHLYFNVPIGTHSISVLVHAAACAGVTQGWDVSFHMYCSAVPGQALQACCPPDPQLLGQLQQIQNVLATVVAALPVPIRSFANGTVHAGLSGSGNFATGVGTIAVKVDLTTIPSSIGRAVGDPTYYFEVGWVTTSAAGGDYQGTRIGYDGQLIYLGPLVDEIHYTLAPNVIATITELTRGP